jgi:Protein of unknown function DUF262
LIERANPEGTAIIAAGLRPFTKRAIPRKANFRMKITCLDKQVGQLLKESFYRIPRFQRPYSWERANVEEFWNDAVVENEAQYFIGNFVVYDDKTAMGVVDGQQRLTTITLLLCALRNAFQKEGFTNFDLPPVFGPVITKLPGFLVPLQRPK